jgi:hypothetical protein
LQFQNKTYSNQYFATCNPNSGFGKNHRPNNRSRNEIFSTFDFNYSYAEIVIELNLEFNFGDFDGMEYGIGKLIKQRNGK